MWKWTDKHLLYFHSDNWDILHQNDLTSTVVRPAEPLPGKALCITPKFPVSKVDINIVARPAEPLPGKALCIMPKFPVSKVDIHSALHNLCYPIQDAIFSNIASALIHGMT